jgi:SAM-dependent methyltransferase
MKVANVFDSVKVQADHELIYRNAQKNGGTEKFIRFGERCVSGHWKSYAEKLAHFSRPIAGGTFLDFGCKFGHLTPLLSAMGVTKVFGVDVDLEHVEQARKFFSPHYGAEFYISNDCYIDVPTASVDFILVNEVISHINPAYLENFYQEMSRVMRLGGRDSYFRWK